MADETFRLKVMLEKGEVHIHANRAGLRDLAKVCTGLSAESDEDAKTAANHFIYADYMNSADDGSPVHAGAQRAARVNRRSPIIKACVPSKRGAGDPQETRLSAPGLEGLSST